MLSIRNLQQAKHTNNSAMPPSGRPRQGRAVSAWKKVGEVAQSTKNKMTERIRRFSSADSEDEMESWSRAMSESRSRAGSSTHGDGSPRVRSASPNRLSCHKCESSLEAGTKYFCTECKFVYCGDCSSRKKLLLISDEKHKPRAQMNKLDICLSCFNGEPPGPKSGVKISTGSPRSTPAASPQDRKAAATGVVRFSPPQRRTDSQSNRPPPKRFAAMDFQFQDLDEISLTPENIKFKHANTSCVDLSLDDVLAGLDELIPSAKKVSQTIGLAAESAGSDDVLCSIDDSSTHSDGSPYRGGQKARLSSSECELFSPLDVETDAKVLNAFRYPLKSPAAKTLSADMEDCSPPATPWQPSQPTGSIVTTSVSEPHVDAGATSVTCGNSGNALKDAEMSRDGGASAILDEAESEFECGDDVREDETHEADLSHRTDNNITENNIETVYNETNGTAGGDPMARSPGCDTSAEANSEASPSGREEAAAVHTFPPIQETSQEGSPSCHNKSTTSGTDHISPIGDERTAAGEQPKDSPLVQEATPQGKGESTYISPPWTNGSTQRPKSTDAKAMRSADSNRQNSYFVSPAMHSLEYSGGSSLSSAWTTHQKTGKTGHSATPMGTSPAAVLSRGDFESIIGDSSRDRAGSDCDSADRSMSSPVVSKFSISSSPSPRWASPVTQATEKYTSNNSRVVDVVSKAATPRVSSPAPRRGGMVVVALLLLVVALGLSEPANRAGLTRSFCSMQPAYCPLAWGVKAEACDVLDPDSHCHPSSSIAAIEETPYAQETRLKGGVSADGRLVVYSTHTPISRNRGLSMPLPSIQVSEVCLSIVNIVVKTPVRLMSSLWAGLRAAMRHEVQMEY